MRARVLAKWLTAASVLTLAACASPSGTNVGTPSGDAASLVRLAETTRANGDPAASLPLYRRAQVLNPQDPTPLIGMGEALNELGSYLQANDAWTKALVLDPGNPDVLTGFGVALTGLNQPHLALPRFQSAVAIRPNARAYNGLGVAYDMLGEPENAQSSYRAGLSVEPGHMGLTSNLGLSFALSGRYSEAIAMLERAAALPGAGVRQRQNLALAYGLAGEMERAEELARADLDEQSVLQNMAFYNTLRAMTDHAQKVAALGELNQRIAPAAGRP